MSVLTATRDMETVLRDLKETAEIRNGNGEVIGYFTPIDPADREMRENSRKAAALFDLDELERLKRSYNGEGYSIEEVMEHLRSLDP